MSITSTIQHTFPCPASQLWDIITSLHDYEWRSDLDRIEVGKDETTFIEYTKDGFSTTFTITCKQPFTRYEFDMDNVNMQGHWTGVLQEQEHQTTVILQEDITVKKKIMKPFAKAYLKKQQAAYLRDLETRLKQHA